MPDPTTPTSAPLMSAPIPRTFAQTLEALRYGTLADELTDKLIELTALCANTQKVGEITLSLKLKPGKGGQIEVFDEVKVREPKQERASSIMFVTPENHLTREDPRQLKLPGLRTIDSETGEIRKVG